MQSGPDCEYNAYFAAIAGRTADTRSMLLLPFTMAITTKPPSACTASSSA
jgi:hypothetical protein